MDPEDEIIELLRAHAPAPPVGWLGIGDDAAVVSVEGSVTLLTTDTMVEGRHWDHRLSAEDVGWKLVAVNVSDIGAMGGRPTWALLALTLPSPLDREWVRGFARGLGAGLRRWGVALVGGDTTGGPARVASLTLGGAASRPIRRSGGVPGDDLYVTGPLGRAAEAFLATHPRAEAAAWFRRPCPPVELGARLGESGLVHAMMDLSDGLSKDLTRLCRASGCGAWVDPALLPGEAPLSWKVGFGEDYELLFAAPREARSAVERMSQDIGIPLHRVGALEPGSQPRLVGGDDWPKPMDTHFPEPPP